MNTHSHAATTPMHLLRVFSEHWRLWVVPTVVLGVLAAIFALVRSPTWEASQAMTVRNVAAYNQSGPGNFSHSDQMKTLQETILELGASRGVLCEALQEVGPPADATDVELWPSLEDVADLRDALKLVPPKGAEFGTTEIFYLRVRDKDRTRAIALAEAISQRLQSRLQRLRDEKARSMIDELSKIVRLAQADLDDCTARLTDIETQVGSDLGELRILHDVTTGDSALQRTVSEIQNELRLAETAQKTTEELLAVLISAQEDPGRLVATPNQLLESQPALRRLKDGLVDAQLRTARLQGRMSDEHPLVRTAQEAERKCAEHLHNELALARRGAQVELRVTQDRITLLRDRLDESTRRLCRLAALRASYSSEVAGSQHRTLLLEQAQQNLAEARASLAGANAVSLITPIDTPDTGNKPVGPGRAMIALLGVVGGLAIGFGLVLLVVQPGVVIQAHAEISPPFRPLSPGAPAPQTDEPRSRLAIKKALQKLARQSPSWN